MRIASLTRKAFVGLALTASLLVPQVALAAQSTGDTPESLTVAASISALFPASATYGPSDGSNFPAYQLPNGYYTSGEQIVQVVSSNAPNGLTIKASAEVFTLVSDPSKTVATTNRAGSGAGYSQLGSGASLTPHSFTEGDMASSSTQVLLADAGGPVANRQVGFIWGVPKSVFTYAGTWTSTVHYIAATID